MDDVDEELKAVEKEEQENLESAKPCLDWAAIRRRAHRQSDDVDE